MSISVQYIIDRARTILQDTNPVGGGVRWKDSELIQWINDAQREIVVAKPSANPATEVLNLVAGSLQTLPAGSISLIKCIRNMNKGVTNDLPGRSVYASDLDAFIAEYPNWHDATDEIYTNKDLSEVSVYFYEDNSPRQFYVFPPNDGTGKLEVIYSKNPTDISTVSDNLTINDIYANQVVDYVLFRAYMKDAGNAETSARAQRHYQLFRESLGLRAQAQLTVSPNNEVAQSKAMG